MRIALCSSRQSRSSSLQATYKLIGVRGASTTFAMSYG